MHKMKKYFLRFLVVFLFGNQFILQAQNPLSLSDAIALSLENNYQVKISKENLKAATANNTWGQAGLYPTLSFNLMNNNSLTKQDNPTSFINGEYSNKSYRGNLDLNWVVFGGFKVIISKQKFELLEVQTLGNSSLVIENTIQAVIMAYHNALLEKEKQLLIQKVLDLSKDRYTYTAHKKELGATSTFEVLQAKSTMLQDSASKVSQEISYRNSKRNLNLLMGRDVELEFELKDELKPDVQLYDFNTLKEKMLLSNHTLKNQYINLELMKKEAQLVNSYLYPKITLSTGLNKSGNKFQLEDFPSRSGNSDDYYVNFALNYSLFNGGKAKIAIENAKIQEKIALLSKEEMELKMFSQLTSIFDLFKTRQLLYSISRENVVSSQMNLDLAQDKFKNGSINSFEFRDVQLNYFNILQANLNSIYNLIETNTELIRISGGILEIN
jgi:outer membrane protein